MVHKIIRHRAQTTQSVYSAQHTRMLPKFATRTSQFSSVKLINYRFSTKKTKSKYLKLVFVVYLNSLINMRFNKSFAQKVKSGHQCFGNRQAVFCCSNTAADKAKLYGMHNNRIKY